MHQHIESRDGVSETNKFVKKEDVYPREKTSGPYVSAITWFGGEIT